MKEYRPVVNGRASICTWQLGAYFLTAEQRDKAVHKILEKYPEVDMEVHVVYGDPTKYCIFLNEFSWANNLTEIGRILEECDYRME